MFIKNEIFILIRPLLVVLQIGLNHLICYISCTPGTVAYSHKCRPQSRLFDSANSADSSRALLPFIRSYQITNRELGRIT